MMPIIDEIPEPWLYPASLEEAAQVQRFLAQKVIVEDALGSVELVGGVDVSNNLYDPAEMVYAAVVSLNVPQLQVIDSACDARQSKLPYVPGFLAFREVPALVGAIKQLSRKPDLILVDGHGISHPRGLGIASHLGVLLDCPTIGVAKSILVGKPAGELAPEAGSSVPLVWQGREIAVCLRSKLRSNPLYISPGHKISQQTAVEWVLNCLKGYRLPEPTRQAHLAANQHRKMAVVIR
jgi:deoxyribonuclease V